MLREAINFDTQQFYQQKRWTLGDVINTQQSCKQKRWSDPLGTQGSEGAIDTQGIIGDAIVIRNSTDGDTVNV